MRNPRNDAGGIESEPFAPNAVERRERGRVSSSLDTNGDVHTPERICVLTRRKGSKDELIRLALSPDSEVAPDVRARAPGRGAWIGVARGELEEANAKGRLKAALQRAFKTSEVRVPANLGERIEHALRKAALDRLGMEVRAGNLINGADRVEAAARAGKVHLLVHALDASEDGRRRMDQAWRVGGGGPQGMIFPEGRTMLSLALGRENVVHVALTDLAAASRVSRALARWQDFTDPDRGLGGGEPALGTVSTEADLTKE
jgi:predicted RNA-binding protein YlxR (DUF448 family)